jgi:release factor glutamine methyltransferase
MKDKLSHVYDTGEVRAFINIAFEHYLNISPASLPLRKQDRISESELLKFNFFVKDLLKQKPVQYILGETEFYGLKLKVNSSVLIPRPETEELVHLILEHHKGKGNLKILDLCTGSGCIAIALKKNLPDALVFAADISEDALLTAFQNANLANVEVNFFRANVLEELELPEMEFDIIVSNPPYVLEFEKELMHKNVLDYEPHLALFVADKEPFLFYEAIAQTAFQKLKSGGRLYFEINESKAEGLTKILANFGFTDITLKKDLPGKDRMIYCTKK